MFKILIFSSLFLCCGCRYDYRKDYSKIEEIDPTKYDYCRENCDRWARSPDDRYGTHAACDCTTVPDRQLINLDSEEAIVEFRRDMVDFHNYWRNFSASGRETRPIGDPIPAAADMEVLNYDLQLEYIAKCRALNSFGMTTNVHERCRYIADGRPYGQNVFMSSYYWRLGDYGYTVKWEYLAIKGFYDEVRYLPNATIVYRFISNMPVTERGYKPYGHWSAMIWATANRIGCVRSYQTNNRVSTYLRYTLICNYACDHAWTAPNMLGERIFTPGRPCSRCPKNKRCNRKYNALCGELWAVPQQRDMLVRSSGFGSEISQCCSFSGLVIFLLNYTLYFVLYKWFL